MMRETTSPAPGARPPRRRATPLARRIALEHGLDLGAIEGTGPGGRIGAADVRAALAPPRRPAEAQAPAEPRSAADAPAAGPLASWSAGLPIETLTVEVDVTEVLAAAAAARAPAGRQALPVGLAAVVVAVAAELLPAHPPLNGAWGGDVALLRRRVHIAVGETRPEGLRWTVVADAGDLTARGVARALAGGAGAGVEATFAVVSLTEGAGWQSAAPPLPGTAAALSVGAPARRLACWGDGVAVRALATMTLSYDARLVDQGRAARFLRALRKRLEGPQARAVAARVL